MSKKILSLDHPVQALYKNKSVFASKLEKSGIETIRDLIWLFPNKIFNIPSINKFENAIPEQLFKGQGIIKSIIKKPAFNKSRKSSFSSQKNLIINILDLHSSQTINLKWFNIYPGTINQFTEGQNIIFHGTISVYNDLLQIINPEICEATSKDDESLLIQYPTVSGIAPGQIKKIIRKIPSNIFLSLVDTLPKKIKEKYNYPNLEKCFLTLHGLKHSTNMDREDARNRLIYEEFFQEQIHLLKRKESLVNTSGIEIHISKKDFETITKSFPFTLTKDQKTCLEEIRRDLSNSSSMIRLIQGDVGSGKTCIAIVSTLISQQSSMQTAIMCPTESLAIQHYQEFSKILSKHQIEVCLLTSSTLKKDRALIEKQLISGQLKVIIGTHALITTSVVFKDLGLVIIDEQHKFGVNQRLDLLKKGRGANCLIMTATPIPRSLRLTQFGDLDISTIKTMPKLRSGYKTRIIRPHNLQNFFNFVATRLSMKEQVYMVVPTIFEETALDTVSLEMIFEKTKKIFPGLTIECLHGQMKSSEKSDIFTSFKEEKIDILIATSVIEVGIDNHNATIMAIFGPERFGLSSLHQLRGRVGRGVKPGFCFLITDNNLKASGLKRLKVLEKSDDGFIIAEEDLKNRGEGDLFGVFQSGKENTKKIANIVSHS